GGCGGDGEGADERGDQEIRRPAEGAGEADRRASDAACGSEVKRADFTGNAARIFVTSHCSSGTLRGETVLKGGRWRCPFPADDRRGVATAGLGLTGSARVDNFQA